MISAQLMSSSVSFLSTVAEDIHEMKGRKLQIIGDLLLHAALLLMTPPALLGMALVIVHLHLIKVMGDF